MADDTEGADGGTGVLPATPAQAAAGLSEEDARQYIEHLEKMKESLEEYGDPGVGGLTSVNEAAVRRAGELLGDVYAEADEYGDREAEIAAVLALLDVDLEVGSVWNTDQDDPGFGWGCDDE